MNEPSFIGLIHNITLLLALALIFDVIALRWRNQPGWLRDTVLGFILGAIGVMILLTPWVFIPGIIFDTRSILMGISGLFFGVFPTLIAMIITVAFRLYLGGSGTWVGIVMTLTTGAIGIVWRYLRRRPLIELAWQELYLFGLVIHIDMLATTLLFPWETTLQVLARISLPVLVIYPVGTALLGALLVNRLQGERIMHELRSSEEHLRQITKDLQKSEEKYRVLTESIQDIVWVLDPESLYFLYVSPSVEKMRGYTAEEVLAQPVNHALTPEASEYLVNLIRSRAEAFRTGQEPADKFYVNELKQTCKDGSTIWTEVITNCYFNQETGRVEMRGVTRDIRERKRAEEAIQKEKIFTEAIFASVPGLLYLYDDQGYLLRWNKRHEEITGYSSEELDHFYILDWYKDEPEDIERVTRGVQKALAEGFATAEANLITKNGTRILFDFTAARLNIDDKVYFTGIGIDITERRKTEEKERTAQAELQRLLSEAEQSRWTLLNLLEDQKEIEEQMRQLNTELEQRVAERTLQLTAANKELEAFAYSVSHDLRAPLRAMEGFSLALLQDYPDQLDEQGQFYLTRIREAARRMDQLINDLLNLSRVARTQAVCQEVDLSEMAHEIEQELRTVEPQRQVEFDIPASLPAYGDAHLLKIVLANLLANAHKFTRQCEQAHIQLGVLDQEGERVYYVRDNGIGFSMEYAGKLFSPFQRLHNVQEYPGTGIGLSIVQRIIGRHGGRIWPEAAEGQGTTFYFTLNESRK